MARQQIQEADLTTSDGLVVTVRVAKDLDGTEFVAVEGVNCDLRGEEPGAYYPVARESDITTPTITDEASVRAWFRALDLEEISFHPEDSFADIISDSGDGTPLFTDEQAARMDAAMAKAYEVCEDPCAVALKVTQGEFTR